MRRALLAALLVASSMVAAPAAGQEPGTGEGPVAFVEIAGADRVATALAASRHAFPDGARSVVVASARSFPDALAAAPLAVRDDAPLLLVDRTAEGPVLEEIERLGAARALLVAGFGAVPVAVQLELRRAGLRVERLAGDGRFDTAAAIARQLGPGADGEVVLASGAVFPDALSAAPLAAMAGMPVLLAAPDGMPPDSAAALADLVTEGTLLVGGESALGPEVEDAAPRPRRLAGPDRYRTGLAVAVELLARGGSLETVTVATGTDFADALAAGPVAARAGGPLLLLDGGDAEQADVVYGFLRRRRDEVRTVLLFGGESAITPAVRERLRAVLEGEAR